MTTNKKTTGLKFKWKCSFNVAGGTESKGTCCNAASDQLFDKPEDAASNGLLEHPRHPDSIYIVTSSGEYVGLVAGINFNRL